MHRVLKDDGMLIIHTAPNVWYDRYAYPVVRQFRRLIGQGRGLSPDPRQFLVEHNRDVRQRAIAAQPAPTLRRAGFDGRVWLDSPPQHRREFVALAALRYVLFRWPPFRWFFEREVFAVASKRR